MKNITTFLSDSLIKPELTAIYITTNKDNKKVAVATDSFKLTEYVLPDYLQEHLPLGYVSKEIYKNLTKLFNKKTLPVIEIQDLINFNTSQQYKYKDYSYPEYTRIIPIDTDLQDFDVNFNSQFMAGHLISFLELIGTKIDFRKIRQNTKGGMVMYKNSEITLLLMPTR